MGPKIGRIGIWNDLDQRNHRNFGFLKARDGDFLLL